MTRRTSMGLGDNRPGNKLSGTRLCIGTRTKETPSGMFSCGMEENISFRINVGGV